MSYSFLCLDLTISHYYSMADMSTLNNIDSNSMCDQTSNSLSIKSPWKLNEEIQSKELKTSISNLSEVLVKANIILKCLELFKQHLFPSAFILVKNNM